MLAKLRHALIAAGLSAWPGERSGIATKLSDLVS
jgi:hypothetical protein